MYLQDSNVCRSCNAAPLTSILMNRLALQATQARPRKLAWRGALIALVASALVVLSGCAGSETEDPRPSGAATHRSGPIALAPDGLSVWVVNPDADSVTRLDTLTQRSDTPIPVGREPWSVAVTQGDTVVVANRADGTISVIRGAERRDVRVGAEPNTVVLSPDGRHAYVGLGSEQRLVKLDLNSMTQVADGVLPAPASALAVAVDPTEPGGYLIVVAHLLAQPLPSGGPHLNDGMVGALTVLRPDLSEAGALTIDPFEFGFPNVLAGIDARDGRVWVAHNLNSPEPPLRFNKTVSSALSSLALDGVGQPLTLDLNDPTFSTPLNQPTAIALTADGTRAYVVLAGSDQLMGLALDDPAKPRLLGFWPTGANPRGVALSRYGRTAYVMNYLSRDVSILDLSDPRNRTGGRRESVAPETLDPETWLGKRLFNNASDPRISTLGWISCASCHPGGGSDGTTWSLPEGPRQTTPLWSLTLRGPPFHASATRDEPQDVQLDIELLMRGLGFSSGPSYPLLGTPNGGRSADLDALAAFIMAGIRTPAASSGIDETAAARGRDTYEVAGCTACHGGAGWTRNALPGAPGTVAGPTGDQVDAALHDVGTYPVGQSGLGELGFKIPTLLGLHATAPYLHNGAATDLRAVLANPLHVGVIAEADLDDLVAFLLSIDDSTSIFD